MKTCLVNCMVTAILLVAFVVTPSFESIAFQKQGDFLWYKSHRINRIKKPNRRFVPSRSKVQNLPLLTLQLRVLKLREKATEEVSPETEFKSGDQIKIGITPNQDGYLYVIFTNEKGGILRNDQVFVRKDKEHLLPSDCRNCVLEFTPPAGIEEIIVIFSRSMITNLPSKPNAPYSLINLEVLKEIKSRSGQVIKETPGKIARLLRGDDGRFAFLVQNTNTTDNEELVVTLRLKNKG